MDFKRNKFHVIKCNTDNTVTTLPLLKRISYLERDYVNSSSTYKKILEFWVKIGQDFFLP